MNTYFTILPANVRYDNAIPPSAKLIYSELLALSGKKGFCYASNRYLGNLYGLDKATVSRLISKLAKRGYIFFKPIDENVNPLDEFSIEYRRIYLSPIDKNINPNNKKDNKKSNKTPARKRAGTTIHGAYDLEAFCEMVDNKEIENALDVDYEINAKFEKEYTL